MQDSNVPEYYVNLKKELRELLTEFMNKRIDEYVRNELANDVAVVFCLHHKNPFNNVEECKQDVMDKMINVVPAVDGIVEDYERIIDYIKGLFAKAVIKRLVNEITDKLNDIEYSIRKELVRHMIDNIISVMYS